jgi:hypothetical protein
MPSRRKLGIVATALAASSVAVAVATAPTPTAAEGDPSTSAGLRAVRAFTERYQSEAAAIDDGFAPTDECIPGMGYHYVNFARLDTTLEPRRPEALLYEPGGDGNRRLVGAEWIVIDSDQDLATDNDTPSLFGHDFDGPMPGHTPGMPVHYDLHAYAWIDNPNGPFATWNPTITCE